MDPKKETYNFPHHVGPPPLPTDICWCCGGGAFHLNQTGTNYVCNICHPATRGQATYRLPVPIPTLTIDPKEAEMEALRKRVAIGVEKHIAAWIKINSYPSEQFTELLHSFLDSLDKLKVLCSQLEQQYDYHECLWPVEPYPQLWGTRRGCNAWADNMFCWVCPKTIAELWANMEKLGMRPPSPETEFLTTLLEYV